MTTARIPTWAGPCQEDLLHAASATEPRETPTVELAAATIVRDGVFEPLTGDPSGERSQLGDAMIRALSGESSIWLDMNLHDDPTRWVEPWMEPARPGACSAGEELNELLVATRHSDRSRPQVDAALAILEQLPWLNELGVLRRLTRELENREIAAELFPLVGVIPTSTLDDPKAPQEGEGPLEFVLLRVNAAVIGGCLFTIRLPDRLCSGSRPEAKAGRRMAAAAFFSNLPNLSVIPHFLPPGETPTAKDMGDALGTYLSATLACAPEYVRRRLFPIEHDVRKQLNRSPDPNDEDALEQYGEVLELRMTLQLVQEELRRLLQRLSEGEFKSGTPGCRIRLSYESALEEITVLQQALRQTGDGLAAKLEQQRNQGLQTLIGGIGALLVLPALVATLFTDEAKLPVPGSGIGLVAMTLLMIGVAVLGWRLLGTLTSGSIWSGRLRLGGVNATRTQWLTSSGFLALGFGLLLVVAM